jgi:hypothetical protein
MVSADIAQLQPMCGMLLESAATNAYRGSLCQEVSLTDGLCSRPVSLGLPGSCSRMPGCYTLCDERRACLSLREAQILPTVSKLMRAG